jgi:hypothetical protein
MRFLRDRLDFYRSRSAFWWVAYLVGTVWALAVLVYFASREEWLWFALFFALFPLLAVQRWLERRFGTLTAVERRLERRFGKGSGNEH